jgi:hypothetical protein
MLPNQYVMIDAIKINMHFRQVSLGITPYPFMRQAACSLLFDNVNSLIHPKLKIR